MNIFKLIFGHLKSRIWFIVTAVMIVLLIVANIVVSNYSDIISVALGGDKQILIEDTSSGTGETTKEHIYEKTTASKDEANQKGFDLTKRVAEEGFILLKNNETLPLGGSGLKVSVFGKNSVNLVYGGTGSGGGDLTFAKKTIFEGLEAEGIAYNTTLRDFYNDNNKSGKGRDSSPSLSTGSAAQDPMNFGETSVDSYTADVTSSYSSYKDAAIIVFSRYAGESWDLPKAYGADRDQKHALALDKNERALINHVKASGFEKIIVVLNTLNIIEAGDLESDPDIDSIIWVGGPGSTGIMALAEILTGKVNPSGHTVDIWSKDFTKDPTWNNFSEAVDDSGNYIGNSAKYSGAGLKGDETFVRYQEQIYMGYRYYETKSSVMNDGGAWYAENVVYPFGYGLSYTTFEWAVEDKAQIENVGIAKDGSYTVKVKVTNKGAYAGKDVVQMYAKLPYTAGGIEKPYEVLCGFAKTGIIQPGESEVVTLTFNPYDVASYDCYDKNGDGKTGWVLEAGNYELLISSDSSADAVKATIPFKVDANLYYETDPTTNNTVENRYTAQANSTFNSDYQLGTTMTRESFVLPTAPTAADRAASEELVDALNDVNHNNTAAASYTQMPEQGKATSLTLSNLIGYDETTKTYGAAYDGQDDKWNEIVGAYELVDMLDLVNQGGFKTNRMESIQKPETMESDGPVGWCNFISTDDTYKYNVAYTSQVVVSSTWNVDLAKEMGECVGEEALWGAARTDGRSYSGWYSPGVNLHRSAFCGRNFEYYSEDPFLTGKIAASLVEGCRNKGVYCYVKHFAVNEQETSRSGVATYMTEQTLRELYLKAFEITVKEGKATGIMSSFNRLGTRWTGGDYRLITEILRNEWGFKGTVISDYNTGSPFMNVKQMIYAGGDLNLATDKNVAWNLKRKDATAADLTVLRNATKNILYTVSNSNAVNPMVDKASGSVGEVKYRYEPATWKILFPIVQIVIGVALVVWGVFAILASVKEEKKAKAGE